LNSTSGAINCPLSTIHYQLLLTTPPYYQIPKEKWLPNLVQMFIAFLGLMLYNYPLSTIHYPLSTVIVGIPLLTKSLLVMSVEYIAKP